MYDKVKAIAEKKGMNISELERKAGLSNGTIGKWREAKNGIRFESIKAVAEALEISIEELT